MDKRPLIVVSLCAVVLLVLSSLSNVVGYQSVKSTVNNSPLFQTRTQRATNQQQNSISSRYLGMGRHNLLQFPIKNNTTDSLQSAVAYIKKMDAAVFNAFIAFVIKHLKQNHQITDETSREIRTLLKQIKEEPLLLPQINLQNFDTNARYATEFCFPTYEPYTLCAWSPGCLIFCIIIVLIKGLIIVPLAILQILWELLEPIIGPWIILLYYIWEDLKSYLTYAVCKTDSGILHIL